MNIIKTYILTINISEIIREQTVSNTTEEQPVSLGYYKPYKYP